MLSSSFCLQLTVIRVHSDGDQILVSNNLLYYYYKDALLKQNIDEHESPWEYILLHIPTTEASEVRGLITFSYLPLP